MDLHMKQKLDTVTVFDLMNNSFYIPDYQRGYRWTHLEVEKLLGDLEDFYNVNTDGSTFYCMQPLVVFFNKEQDAWEVIDGQQRLTTMYLILNQQKGLLEQIYPDMKLFNLSYQSRPDSRQYLENIDSTKSNSNIDYYHMFNASAVITDFLKKTTLGGWRFVDAIVNANNIESRPSVKFIWYDVTEEIESKHISPEEKFSDLNIGKIGLTNAELIKALFLNNVGDDESESLRIASEWDSIEHALQDDSFWSFIYGKDDNKYATRIELLFDIIKAKSATEQNEYYTFDAYSEEIKTSGQHTNKKDIVKRLWKDVSDKYYLFRGWYDDKKLYHIIGYLRYKKEVLRQMGELLTPEFISGKETKESVTVFCFTIKVPKKQPEKKPYIILVDNDEEYCVKMSDSAKGNARRVLNFIQSFNKVPNDIQNSIWDTYSKMGSIRNLLDNPDETNIIRLRRAEENLSRIKMLINS